MDLYSQRSNCVLPYVVGTCESKPSKDALKDLSRDLIFKVLLVSAKLFLFVVVAVTVVVFLVILVVLIAHVQSLY